LLPNRFVVTGLVKGEPEGTCSITLVQPLGKGLI
jgi:hypothetical protein